MRSSPPPNLPNFLVLGAAKSGTTSLFEYLRQHPDIYLPLRKETNFFACQGLSLDQFRWYGDPPAYLLASLQKLSDYQAVFRPAEGRLAIGEVSTAYLYHPNSPQNIRQLLPQAKLVAILRHPIQRAYAHYQHLRRMQREPHANFMEALNAEAQRFQHNYIWDYFYCHQGFYFQQLQRYYALFPAHHIRVYLFEDLQKHSHRLLGDLFQFLEVRSDFPIDTHLHHNPGGLPRHPWLGRLITTHNPYRTFINRLLPTRPRQKIKASYIKVFYRPTPPIPPEAYDFLLHTYRPEILKLQDLLQRDLSSWLTPDAG